MQDQLQAMLNLLSQIKFLDQAVASNSTPLQPTNVVTNPSNPFMSIPQQPRPVQPNQLTFTGTQQSDLTVFELTAKLKSCNERYYGCKICQLGFISNEDNFAANHISSEMHNAAKNGENLQMKKFQEMCEKNVPDMLLLT